jgi:NitT/TauT family transport system substrate-binding protein
MALQPTRRLLLAAALALGALCAAPGAVAADKLTQVRMTIDEDPIVIRLGQSLGYFQRERIEILPVDLERLAGEDYLMQEPLMKGQIDAAYHWFNHAIFGARHGFPIQAVMLFNDAPGMTVMVANRVKDKVRGVADFKGRNVAEGAGYGTKSLITHYLAQQAGLPPNSYTPVALGKEGRTEAVIQGLKDGTVDAMTFQEPVTSALLTTGMVTPLLDLNSKAGTEKALGAAFPAQSLLVSPRFAQTHGDTVQRLVNALVRTMRFINSHTLEQIVEKLPGSYFAGKDRAAQIKLLRDTLPSFANGDYAFAPRAVRLAADMNLGYAFDSSEEGQWRAGGDKAKVQVDKLYDNRFVTQAMRAIP